MAPVGCELIVVGCSWGGLAAVTRVLASLPGDLDAAMVVAQHRGPGRSALASLLSRQSPWAVAEAEDKQPIVSRQVYLAPGGYHLLVERGHLALSTEGPVHHSRPSIDVLFESAADAYRDAVVGVVLTGANEDGAAGLMRIVERGGRAVVQDPASAERAEMPRAALATGIDAAVLPLDEIGPFLGRLCQMPRVRSAGAAR